MKVLSPTDQKYFYSSGRPNDVRLGDVFFRLEAKSFEELQSQISQEEMKGNATLVLGYPSDDTKTVEGKFTTKKSPSIIRQNLFQLTPPYFVNEKLSFVDCGRIHSDTATSEFQKINEEIITSGIHSEHRWLTFGGGMEWHYSEVAGWLKGIRNEKNKNEEKKRPLLIQFSSLLSMKGRDQLTASSLNKHLPELGDFDLLLVGPHLGHCSNEERQAFLENPNWRVIDLELLSRGGFDLYQTLLRECEDWLIPQRDIWICVDFTVFGLPLSGLHPKSRALGVPSQELLRTLSILWLRNRTHGLSLFNVDSGQRQSLLYASEIAYRYLYNL